ncbi:MAG: phytanoyl-CoA dioxygenase family protein [Pseudomonadota bacterium]
MHAQDWISDDDKQLYADEGYMILERAIPADALDMLRQECAYFVGYMDAKMDAGQLSSSALSSRGNRYYINAMYRYSQRLWRFLFSDVMADVCRATLGDDAYLFSEQWVVKGAEQGMKFSWHQDSGYVKAVDANTTHPPYVTCWCTLDDVSEENGTVYLLPHSRGGTRNTIITHSQDPDTNDLIGYTGDDSGIAIEVPAGSIVCFSSYNLHSSGANTTPNMRRVYLPQYASAPINLTHNGERLNMAVPFLHNGENVYDHDADSAERFGGAAAPSLAA